MRVKCENKAVCGYYACVYNTDGYCGHTVVAMDETGRCVLARVRKEVKQKPTTPSENSNAC